MLSNDTVSCCHGAVLSNDKVSCCQVVTVAFHQEDAVLFYHAVTVTYCHILLCHLGTVPRRHYDTVSCCQVVTVSFRHLNAVSFYNAVTVAYCHILTMSFCHGIVFS